MKHFDAIVVGIGAMGSAITYHLAKKGMKTLALESFSLNHTNGSSHGRTRIIRTAYSEHPSYVPLAQRALSLWFELQNKSGMRLVEMTGGLIVGAKDSDLVSGALRSATEHKLPYSLLEAAQVSDRFKVFRLSEGDIGIFEPNAGVLFAERCVEAHAKLAAELSAELNFTEPMVSWQAATDRVVANTDKGSYSADRIVFSSGAWTPQLLPVLKLPLQCERQTVFWFRPATQAHLFTSPSMPVFMWQEKSGEIFYGIPDTGNGLKAARHHGGGSVSPDAVNRNVTPDDELPVRQFLVRHVPWGNGQLLDSTTCLYTNSPDGHFLIDFHPSYQNVLIVSACSGHGFKFASVIGEIVSQLATTGRTEHDISLFTLSRPTFTN